MRANRDENGRFVKGNNANPSGRPKGDAEVRELLKTHSVEAARKLVELMSCGIPKLELAAATEILNRTEGKPREKVDMNVSGGLDVRSQIRSILLERQDARAGAAGTD